MTNDKRRKRTKTRSLNVYLRVFVRPAMTFYESDDGTADQVLIAILQFRHEHFGG